MIVVDILPESFNVFQITLTQAVKEWKTEYVMLHRNIQEGRASHSWGPFLGHVMVDIIDIIHTYTCRTIVYNYDAFIYVGNGM